MRPIFICKIFVLFGMILSLSTLSGSLSGNNIPSLPLARAIAAPNEQWVPAGPEIDKLSIIIFGDSIAEYTNLLSATPTIDLTDSPDPSGAAATDCGSPALYFTPTGFCYLSNWQRVINSPGTGTPNYFTWLDAWSPNPATARTLRQGFAGTTTSLNPYVASGTHDLQIIHNIYDSIQIANPLNNAQTLDWMSLNTWVLSGPQLSYVPPPGTVLTYRVTLSHDLFWHDARPVTAFDVAFSYLSLLAYSAFQSSAASALTGLTVLSPTQIDVSVNTNLPLPGLFGLTIIPGSYWSLQGMTAWNSAASSCLATGNTCYPEQYTLGAGTPRPVLCASIPPLDSCSFPATLMIADPVKTAPTYDPLHSGILIGSGPFECTSNTGVLGTGCSSTGFQSPPLGGSFTLQRFGIGITPGSSITNVYFRSAGNLALWIWTNNTASFTTSFLNFGVVAACYGQAPLPLGTTTGCGHWQQGIGASGGPVSVGLTQVSIVGRFVGANWISPFDWTSATLPTEIVPLAPALHEGATLLNPAPPCVPAYPTGGYNC